MFFDKPLSLTVTTAVLSLMAAQAGAQDQEISVNLPYSGVHAARGVNVYLTMGDAASIKADAGDKDFARLEVKVEDAVLHVRRQGGSDDKRFDLDVYVAADRPLDFLKASTGARLDGTDLTLDGEAEILANTGGEMTLSGACETALLKASTGGEIEAEDLICESVTVKTGTGGSIEIHASKTAIAYARMGGEVILYGEAELKKKGASFGGEIRQRK
ncbi:MAG: DUF2807 domain-containing protein [Pseudomonadota bacterium]